jgi:hypothetical protein
MKTEKSEYKFQGDDVIFIDHGQLLRIEQDYEICKELLKEECNIVPKYIAKIQNSRIKASIGRVYKETQKASTCVVADFNKIAKYCQQIIDEFEKANRKLYYYIPDMSIGEMRW